MKDTPETAKPSKRFEAIEIVLLVIIVAMLGFTGWFAWHGKQSADTSLNNASNAAQSKLPATPAVTDYASCLKSAGSITQESYPETCVTKAGKSFVNMAATAPPAPASPTYLEIKELGIKVPLTSQIADAYYTMSKTNSQIAYLSVHSLDMYTGCQAANDGLAAVSSFVAGETDPVVGSYQTAYPDAPKIGDKYFYMSGNQYDCTETKDSNAYTAARTALLKSYTGIQKL